MLPPLFGKSHNRMVGADTIRPRANGVRPYKYGCRLFVAVGASPHPTIKFSKLLVFQASNARRRQCKHTISRFDASIKTRPVCCISFSPQKQFAFAGSPELPCPYLSSRQAMPGNSRPSRNSREAPPPVEMWVIALAKPSCSQAAAESPPPTMVTASESARA